MNMFMHDYTKINEAGGFTPAPQGEYLLVITGTDIQQSQKNDPKVNVALEIAKGPHAGKRLWHNVTFMPAMTNGQPTPGAGFSKHFLHVIGEPFEGKVHVRPNMWHGRKFRALLGVGEYIDKNGKPKPKNTIITVLNSADDVPSTQVNEGTFQDQGAPAEPTEEVPF